MPKHFTVLAGKVFYSFAAPMEKNKSKIKMKSYIEKLQKQDRMQFSSILVSTFSTVAWDHFSEEGSNFHPLSY